MPTYARELYDLLVAEYSVRYYEERAGEYTYCDCFILNGFCIKIDRLDIDELSPADMTILMNSVRDLYTVLVEKWEELGHDSLSV